MKTLLLNSSKLINITQGPEKNLAIMSYATAFCNLIKNGYIYKQETDADGLPSLVITIGSSEFKCNRFLVENLLKNNIELNPFEDTYHHFDDIEPLNQYCPTEIINNTENDNKNNKTTKTNFSEVVADKVAEKIANRESEAPEPEITLSEEKQAEIIMNETEYYKIGTWLNTGLAAACAIFAIMVMIF